MTPTTPLEEFSDALLSYLSAALQASGESLEYCQAAVRIVDAHNHIFVSAGTNTTDEEHGIYAFRDLSALDEDSQELRPDRYRCMAAGRECGIH